MNTKILLIVLILSCLQNASSLTYQTNSVRTKTYSTLCASFSSRSQLVSSSTAAQVDQYNNMMKQSFSVKGSDLFTTIISAFMTQPMNPSTILTTYPNILQEYGLFIGPFALGMVILMATCMCTCCCCCCPNTCPPCKCCKKQMGQTYTKCQLIWPAIVLILALGVIVAAGAIGLSKSKDLQTTIEAVGCSVSIALDDIINGNVTDTGKYFIGLNPLYNSITTIKSNLSNIDAQFTNIIPTGGAALAASNAASAAQTQIDKIPTNVALGKVTAYNYKTAFDNAAATATLASTMPNALGSINAADSSSAIYLSFNGIGAIQNAINQITTGAQGVKTQIAGGFSTALDGAKTALKDVMDLLTNGDTMFFSIYSSITPFIPTINTAVTGIYAGLLGIASVGILATLLILICNLYKCRYLLYFVCVILVVIGVISFILSLVLSILMPLVYFTCDFANYSFSSKANFDSIVGALVPPSMATMTSVISVCLKGQSGDLMQSSIFGSAATSISGLQSVLSSINTFDSTLINAQVDTAWGITKDLVTNMYAGKTLDFVSSSDQAILQRLSQRSNYGCTAANFATDSWIPTTLASPTITCKVSGPSVVATTCANPADWTGGTNGCAGCMDSQQLLQAISGSFVTNLQARYNSGDCMPFINDIQNAYINYYSIKDTTYTPIATRAAAADALVTVYKTTITNLGTAINSVSTSLQGTANAVVDPQYGILAGLNCAIFGQDIILITNTGCTYGFQMMFFIRAAFGIAAFGILATMWCAACTGVRHYKQMQAKKPKINEHKDITNNTLDDLNPKQNNSFANNNIANNINARQYVTNANVTYY